MKPKSIVVLFLILISYCSNAQNYQKPNILVIMFDDAGLDMSAYGSEYVKTPAFDAIAKEGILFNRAYTPNAKCAPSRAAIMTGRNSWQLGAAANHVIYFPPRFMTYQEVLLKNGYVTGHTGKGYAPGKTLTEAGDVRQVMGPAFNQKRLEPPTKYISQNDYSGNFADFLDKAPAGKPWSFWVGSLEPHRQYEYGSGKKIGSKTIDMISDFPPYWPDNETTRNDLLDYAFEIEDTDKHIARIMKTLRERKLLNNTLVVVTSDHGMPFPRVKGNQYENANHVPMAILWKGKMKIQGRKVDDYVSFIDLAPTFLEAAGINWQASGMHPAAGQSLLKIITSEKSGQIEPLRDYVLVGKERHDTGRPDDVGYPIRGLYKNDMLYIKNYKIDRWPSGNPETGYLNTDGSPTKTQILNLRRNGVDPEFWKLNFGKRQEEELYDVQKDPFCIHNLANVPSFYKKKNALKSEMESRLLEQGDLRMRGYGHLYEKSPMVEGRGFYRKLMKGEHPKAGWVNETDFEKYYLDGEGNEINKVILPEINKQ
ncbi:MAG: sulfatase [Flavobacteriaceae bacterium]